MGRLPLVAAAFAACAALAGGCDAGGGPPAGPAVSRHEAVLATGNAEARPGLATGNAEARPGLASGPAAARPVDAASAAKAAPRAPRTLCVGPALDRPLPPGRLAQVAAAGAPPLPERPGAAGRWTWVSLWAAWCGPCKEEAPRLARWQRDLGFELAFISLDDDRRQLVRELEAPPTPALRASYWLPEGAARESFLRALGLKSEPSLPVQLLVAPGGKVHCIIEGAVDDSDFARVAAVVKRR